MYAIYNSPDDDTVQKATRLDMYLSATILILDGILTCRLGWNSFDGVETPKVIKYFWIIFSMAVIVVPFISLYVFAKVKRSVMKKQN